MLPALAAAANQYEPGEALADVLPRRTAAWETLLGSSNAAKDIVVFASDEWHGKIIETLSDANLGRQALRSDGTIEALPPSGSHGRTIFVTWEEAAAINRRSKLVRIGTGGTVGAMHRAERR
jgi:hypothetical protein